MTELAEVLPVHPRSAGKADISGKEKEETREKAKKAPIRKGVGPSTEP